MVTVTIVVRKLGRTEVEYFLPFDLPEVPREGAYISIFRPGVRAERSAEDLIVRHVWWHLGFPRSASDAPDESVTGTPRDIMVECDQAIGPYLVERHRDCIEREAEAKGIEVERFKVARFVAHEPEQRNG